jgi:hypothetical protein
LLIHSIPYSSFLSNPYTSSPLSLPPLLSPPLSPPHTGLIALTEMFFDGRRKGIKMLVVGAGNLVETSIAKFGITNDSGNSTIGMERYSALAGTIIPTTVDKIEELVGVNSDEADILEKGMEKGTVLGNLQVMEDKSEAI